MFLSVCVHVYVYVYIGDSLLCQHVQGLSVCVCESAPADSSARDCFDKNMYTYNCLHTTWTYSCKKNKKKMYDSIYFFCVAGFHGHSHPQDIASLKGCTYSCAATQSQTHVILTHLSKRCETWKWMSRDFPHSGVFKLLPYLLFAKSNGWQGI